VKRFSGQTCGEVARGLEKAFGLVSATAPVIAIDLQGGGAAVGARAARPTAALPCLNTNNCNEGLKADVQKLSSAHRKAVYALIQNVIRLVFIYGINRIGFLTLTFARHVVSYKEAQKALHSLMTGVLKKRYVEYIIVMERMDSKRIHYHLLVVLAEDIRSGFMFAAVRNGDYSSASVYLRREWAFWRVTAPKYGFGRHELMPVKSTADAIAKYLGKYISKHIGQRLPEDKGARLVRYSKGTNRAGTNFSWASTGAFMWRSKLGTFCRMMHLNSDNYKEFLKEWFGKNWIYHLYPLIQSIKLAEFHPEDESRESLKAVWLTTINERERRRPRRHRDAVEKSASSKQHTWASWIERTVKEDA
jgi:hypothetical protein